MSETIERPTLNRLEDVRIRLFIDTNVLIDFVQGVDEKSCKTFLNLFAQKKFENIEMVTSDYVLWEFYGHFKDELYVRKLVEKYHYGYLSASKKCNWRNKFGKATLEDMNSFGETIQGNVKQFENNPIHIERLIGKEIDGFSELVDLILQRSKFSYKDAIVFVSALSTDSDFIITCDEDFSTENQLESVREALDSVKELKSEIKFLKPEEISTEEKVKRMYKDWFLTKNKDRQVGKVLKVWPEKKCIAVECIKDNFLKVGDYLCLIKFYRDIDFEIRLLQIKNGDLWDYETETEVMKGGKVTIKLFPDSNIEPFMEDAMVFVDAA
jgi:predicted nucleic acid-binding protein